MEEDTNWSLEHYTLEEIVKFKLPCEIRMTEGFYDDSDDSEDTFSAGDIITIGEKQTIQKVSARFTKIVNEVSLATPDYDYVKLTGEDQILLPLKYKGILKVLRHLKKFETVRELAEDFPRYAKVCEGFKLRTEDNVSFPINEDTIVELLRINPGSSGVGDELVVRHKYRKQVKHSCLPFEMKKRFEAIQDDDEYTLEDAIKRYKLPLLVRFNNANEIKRAYGHGKTITDTLRLEEKLTQGMLFGNCKLIPEENTQTESESTKGAPIVLPLTNAAVRSIEVHVRPGCTTDYENVAFAHITDGSIYEDYATFSSKIKRLRTEDGDANSAPVLPPRKKPINKVLPTKAPKPKQGDRKLPVLSEEQPLPPTSQPPEMPPELKPDKKHKKDKEHKKRKNDKTPVDVRSETTPALPPRHVRPDTHRGMPLPPVPGQDKPRGNVGKGEYMNHPMTRKQNSQDTSDVSKESKLVHDPKWANLSQKGGDYLKMEAQVRKTLESPDKDLSGYEIMHYTENPVLSQYETITPFDELNPYEEIGTTSPDTFEKHTPAKNKNQNVVLHKHHVHKGQNVSSPALVAKPSQPSGSKPFLELNQEELIERLMKCGLSDVAEQCKEDSTIDGAFFKDLSTELLKESFNFSGIRLAKFLQMRDNNWVPS